jgi:hypothetical protein
MTDLMATMNDETVFVRTEAGQQAVRNPDVALPRALRALLFSIDGASTAGSYAALLSNFGDVYKQLAFLQDAGYIRGRKSRRRPLPADFAAESSHTSPPRDSRLSRWGSAQFDITNQPDTLPHDNHWAESQQTLSPIASASASATAASAGVGGLLRKIFRRKSRDDHGATIWGHSQQFAPSALHEASGPVGPAIVAAVSAPPPAPVLSEAARLQAARELMIDFMHLYLPAIAHEASMSIEALQTREQMLTGLPDYSQLVSRTGGAGMAHLAQLQLTLGQAH